MSDSFSFGGSKKIEERRDEVETFITNILDKEEYPYFISDMASVCDISSLSIQEIIVRIATSYHVSVTEKDVCEPLWHLLEIIRKQQ